MNIDQQHDRLPLPGPEAHDDGSDAIAYLRARRQLPAPRVQRLTGGVSGEVVLVEVPPARLVVKRALEKLLVSGDWSAKPERAMTEAAALSLLHGVTPDAVPRLLDADPETNTLVISAAPQPWVNWKLVLLGELADPADGPAATGHRLGAVLGQWHHATWHDAAVARQFDDYEAFEQLRITPFHRTVAAMHPLVADLIHECISELLSRRDCLVHGDFSPKNVLIGEDGLMVLDFEVAHVGAAVFDLAFIWCHLALKAVHMPGWAAEFAAAAGALLAAHQQITSGLDGAADLTSRLGRHTSCLLLARVDGLSPVSYLSTEAIARVRRLALDLLTSSDPSAANFWPSVEAAAMREAP